MVTHQFQRKITGSHRLGVAMPDKLSTNAQTTRGDRQERRARSLRANLRLRKQQVRARQAVKGDGRGEGDEPD